MKRLFAFIFGLIAFITVNAQNVSTEDYDDGIRKKWELKLDATISMASRGDMYTGDGLTEYDESIGVDLGAGYNFSSNWYAGLSSGYWFHWGGESNNMIPLLVDVVWRWNLGSSEKYSLFLEGRGGVLFGLNSDRSFYKYLPDYQFSDHAYFDIQPGIYFRTRRNFDLRLSFCYGYTKPIHNYERKYFDKMTEEERKLRDKDFYFAQPEHILSLKFGVNFRGKSNSHPRNWNLDDQIRYYKEESEEVNRQAERAEYKAERAAQRVNKLDEKFEQQVQLTQQKEMDLVYYYTIYVDSDEQMSLTDDSKLTELSEWAKIHKEGRIVLKAYVENDKQTSKNVAEARKRIRIVKNVLVKNYGVKAGMIKKDIYVVSEKTAREHDITKRVDVYKKERK